MNKGNLFTKKIGDLDFTLLIATALLVVIGVVSVFSASYYSSISQTGAPYTIFIKQLIYAIAGAVLLYLSSKMNYHAWRNLMVIILPVTILLLLLVLTPYGQTINGASRWISLGFFTIMPGEISKFCMIIVASVYFSANPKRVKNLKGLMPIVMILAIVFLLIMKQPNFSVAATVVFVVIAITIVAGLNKNMLIMSGAGVIAVMAVAVLGDRGGYRFARVTSFLDPFANASGESFQVVQSLMALGSGGVSGVGIGNSVQKTMYLPEPHNDFIMAIIGEEVGFIGVAAIIAIYVIFIWRGVIIAMKAPDLFGSLMATGIVAMVSCQVVFNLAVVTSSMPATGVALPFISYGGNALWIFMTCSGILLNISKERSIIRNFTVEKYTLGKN